MKHAPYNDAAWTAIRACADRTETILAGAGMQLSMGGEPTYVPEHPEGAEWQTAALGPTKLSLARRFAGELIRRSHAGAALLETSGKHYPGEPLPRWSLLILGRGDGKPLWKNPDLLRQHAEAPGHHLGDAERFARRLATRLALEPAAVLAATMDAGTTPAGFVLPLDRTAAGWTTDDWRAALTSAHVPLLHGDSAIGLRLPLGSLAESNLRRALTCEIRDGSVMVFIPPLEVAAFAELLGAIEACLEELGLRQAILAGYAPTPDPQIAVLGLASDPGVIEVNLTACTTWAGYDRQLEEVQAAARSIGLCSRKLQFNGRETGTGGGAHLVFGAPSGHSSPFLAWPGFLPSVIRYWQAHPALSYAFTGQYMGPSSQAPRIDESTFEALYELEIACAGAERSPAPWAPPDFDLNFRDLLMDRSGNTHRAEISVDKLWNPHAPNGRLGLVEFRAFETHPDRAALSLTALFVRSLLARLAAAPYRDPFVRWGGELHDRFFLPSFVWQDLTAIVADLQGHGIPFEAAWLRPLWEWRFPRLGRLAMGPGDDDAIDFRQALEAWPLLGEQGGAGGTSRSVDASNDRIEARLAREELAHRGTLLANGFPCRFRPDGAGGAAGGIRFRAFALRPSLHPHVPVHAPLLLEWVDGATQRVTAAARWHVWNPRHQPYATAPLTAEEARRRHAERWEPWTATIGERREIPSVDFPPEGRHTLDLRRFPAPSPTG